MFIFGSADVKRLSRLDDFHHLSAFRQFKLLLLSIIWSEKHTKLVLQCMSISAPPHMRGRMNNHSFWVTIHSPKLFSNHLQLYIHFVHRWLFVEFNIEHLVELLFHQISGAIYSTKLLKSLVTFHASLVICRMKNRKFDSTFFLITFCELCRCWGSCCLYHTCMFVCPPTLWYPSSWGHVCTNCHNMAFVHQCYWCV